MILLAALGIAAKKAAATFPAFIFAAALSTMGFADLAMLLGPHTLAAIGGLIGTGVRFQMLRIRWRHYPKEGLAAMALGAIFGQAQLPIITDMLSQVSPEMFPVAQGTAIGILMAAGTGFLSDFIEAYRNKLTGGNK